MISLVQRNSSGQSCSGTPSITRDHRDRDRRRHVAARSRLARAAPPRRSPARVMRRTFALQPCTARGVKRLLATWRYFAWSGGSMLSRWRDCPRGRAAARQLPNTARRGAFSSSCGCLPSHDDVGVLGDDPERIEVRPLVPEAPARACAGTPTRGAGSRFARSARRGDVDRREVEGHRDPQGSRDTSPSPPRAHRCELVRREQTRRRDRRARPGVEERRAAVVPRSARGGGDPEHARDHRCGKLGCASAGLPFAKRARARARGPV